MLGIVAQLDDIHDGDGLRRCVRRGLKIRKDLLGPKDYHRTCGLYNCPWEGLKTIRRRQLPVMPANSFTDPFNIYVALSRGRGRDNIRLLWNFDEKLLMHAPLRTIMN